MQSVQYKESNTLFMIRQPNYVPNFLNQEAKNPVKINQYSVSCSVNNATPAYRLLQLRRANKKITILRWVANYTAKYFLKYI